MAAGPESQERNGGWSWGAENHREHPWMVVWGLQAVCWGGQDLPRAACIAMAMCSPTGINESGVRCESFGVEKRSAWPGEAGRRRRAGGRAGGAGTLAAQALPASPAGFAPSHAGCLRCPAWISRVFSVGGWRAP